MERKWIYLSNTFEVQTRGSHVKMLSLSTDTDAKLQNEISDPDINLIYTQYHPVYDAYRVVCINYDMATGNYAGDTLAFEQVLDSLPTDIRRWESGVRAVFIEDSPEERAIFPNKRNPFLEGTYEDRLSAIGTLAEKLSSIPALATTHALVSSFYNTALATRLAQQQKEGAVGLLSDLREQQRVLTAVALYGVLGNLMYKFRANPTDIERFFDLELLRTTGQGQTTGPATINGKVKDALTLTPIVGARVLFTTIEGSVELFTDANGEFTLTTPDISEPVEADMEVSAPGYATKTQTLVVEPGTEENMEVLLVAQP